MTDLLLDLGVITANGVVQLHRISSQLAEGQEKAALRTDLDELRNWLETRFDGVDKLMNTFQEHEH